MNSNIIFTRFDELSRAQSRSFQHRAYFIGTLIVCARDESNLIKTVRRNLTVLNKFPCSVARRRIKIINLSFFACQKLICSDFISFSFVQQIKSIANARQKNCQERSPKFNYSVVFVGLELPKKNKQQQRRNFHSELVRNSSYLIHPLE